MRKKSFSSSYSKLYMVNADVFNAIMNSLDDTEKAKIKEMNNSPYLKEDNENSIYSNSSAETKCIESEDPQTHSHSETRAVSNSVRTPNEQIQNENDMIARILQKLEKLEDRMTKSPLQNQTEESNEGAYDLNQNLGTVKLQKGVKRQATSCISNSKKRIKLEERDSDLLTSSPKPTINTKSLAKGSKRKAEFDLTNKEKRKRAELKRKAEIDDPVAQQKKRKIQDSIVQNKASESPQKSCKSLKRRTVFSDEKFLKKPKHDQLETKHLKRKCPFTTESLGKKKRSCFDIWE